MPEIWLRFRFRTGNNDASDVNGGSCLSHALNCFCQSDNWLVDMHAYISNILMIETYPELVMVYAVIPKWLCQSYSLEFVITLRYHRVAMRCAVRIQHSCQT